MQSDGFYPSKKIKKRGNEYWIVLNLWPFVGILFVLLIILMLTTGPPFAHRHHISNLPVASHSAPLPRAVKDDAIHILVTRDDRIYFGNFLVSLEDIPGKIRESLREGSERRIYMQVDGRTKYLTVKCVLDEIREAEVKDVTFLVEAKRF